MFQSHGITFHVHLFNSKYLLLNSRRLCQQKYSDKYNNFSSEFLKWVFYCYTVIHDLCCFFVKLFQRIHLTSPESYQLQQTAEEDWRVYLLKCCDKTEKARKLVASNNTKSQKFWMMVNLFMSLVQSLSIAIGFFSCVTKSQD